jgi:hypothetical protein
MNVREYPTRVIRAGLRDGICLMCRAHTSVAEHLCLLEVERGKRLRPPRRLHAPIILCDDCAGQCARQTFRGLP